MKLREIRKLIAFRNRSKEVNQAVEHSREIAKKKIPKAVGDFIDGGAGDEQAIVANRHSWRT